MKTRINHIKIMGNDQDYDNQIGCVEIKDAESDARAKVSAANAARAATDKVLLVQQIDEAGNVVGEGSSSTLTDVTTQQLGSTPAELTNIAANTTGYLYLDMETYKTFALQCKTSGATPTDTLTLTVEATWQDDETAQGSCAYQDVTEEWFGVTSVVDEDCVFEKDTPTTAKYVRLKYVTSDTGGGDADLTVYARKIY